jgi:hypothetical protein
MCCIDRLKWQHIPVIEPAKEVAGSRHAWWLKFDRIGRLEGVPKVGALGDIGRVVGN